MWSVRILNGPQAGQIIDLRLGRNLLGRTPQCDIKILSPGISKEHCEIHVYKEKIMVVDLRSSNGTFVNGVKIQNGLIRLGDKIGVHDIIFDLIATPDIRPRTLTQKNYSHNPTEDQSLRAQSFPPQSYGSQPYGSQPFVPQAQSAQGYQNNLAQQLNPNDMQSLAYNTNQNSEPTADLQNQQPQFQSAIENQNLFNNLYVQLQNYMERVALPGVYKLASLTEFKLILAGFITLFIFSVTLLSLFPMMQITRSSIMSESMRRASSLARHMAEVNQQNFLQGNLTAMSTHSAETEEGVKQAFIIQQSDGMIVAPASRAGRSSDISFVHRARKEAKSTVSEIDSSTIGASYPIGLYDPNTGEPSVKAYAIVIYDISSLSFDSGRTISLFMQTLLIASILGILIFYFMYHLIEYPVKALNQQLDTALREKTDNIQIEFQFPAFQSLVSNVNTLLTRSLSFSNEGMSSSNFNFNVNQDLEAENLVQIIMLPAAAINAQGNFMTCNARFETFARSTKNQIQGQGTSSLGDSSLQQMIDHLLMKTKENPVTIQSDQLDFSGQPCHIHCQAFLSQNSQGNINYFLLVITPAEGGSE